MQNYLDFKSLGTPVKFGGSEDMEEISFPFDLYVAYHISTSELLLVRKIFVGDRLLLTSFTSESGGMMIGSACFSKLKKSKTEGYFVETSSETIQLLEEQNLITSAELINSTEYNVVFNPNIFDFSDAPEIIKKYFKQIKI